MNSKNIVALDNEEIYCWKCLKQFNKNDIHKIHIPSAGYGSHFDNLSTELQLCDSCYKETNYEWWEFKKVPFKEDGGEVFKYDNEIYDYIKHLPLQSQELVWNRLSYGAFISYITMNSQDWIDFELDELSHEKCEEYGLISKEVIATYNERFPSCQYTANKIYNDGSINTWCPFEACEGTICSECYECKVYKKRELESDIAWIKEEDWNDFVIYIEYHIKKDILEDKFSRLGFSV